MPPRKRECTLISPFSGPESKGRTIHIERRFASRRCVRPVTGLMLDPALDVRTLITHLELEASTQELWLVWILFVAWRFVARQAQRHPARRTWTGMILDSQTSCRSCVVGIGGLLDKESQRVAEVVGEG